MQALARFNNAKSPLLYVVVAALLATLIIGGAMAVANHKTVTVDVDGKKISLSTMTGDVQGALAAAGYTAKGQDVVAPSLDSKISNGETVVLRRAREVSVTVDGKPEKVMTLSLIHI